MVDRRRFLLGSGAFAAAALLGGCGGGGPGSSPERTGLLQVPGAQLYYEVRGSGPPLLMIHGGMVDAGSFAAVAPLLAEHRTVITYDRRGNSRSPLAGPAGDLRLDQQAEDAAALLGELVDEPPAVFGSSGGAVVALELTARYGDRLGIVVAHEPPVPAVLPDAAAQQAKYAAVLRTYRSAGTQQAFAEFQAVDPGPPDPVGDMSYPADPALDERIQANLDLLLAHEMLPFTSYRPDLPALRAKGPAFVAGVGRYPGPVARRIVEALATQVGGAPMVFPGDHTGYMCRPDEFAGALHTVLG